MEELLILLANVDLSNEQLLSIKKQVGSFDYKERLNLDRVYFQHIVELLKCRHEKCIKSGVTIKDIDFLQLCLLTIQNSCIQCSKNQNLVVSSQDLRLNLVKSIHWIFTYKNSNGFNSSEEVYKKLLITCFTCVNNLLAGNSNARITLWNELYHDSLMYLEQDETASRVFCCVIHNCILEEENVEKLSKEPNLSNIIKSIIKLDDESKKFNEHIQICLNKLLPNEWIFNNVWDKLEESEKCHVIGYYISIIELHNKGKNDWAALPSENILYKLHSDYLAGVDVFLKSSYDETKDFSWRLLNDLLSLCTTAASSNCLQIWVQKDARLLISNVYLLRMMEQIGASGTNLFTRLSTTLTKEEEESVSSHPIFGFKANLIRLIGLMCYNNKINQDEVREINGILVILENTQMDARNPLIKENALFALRNILENNEENKDVVRGLEIKGVAENTALNDMGIEAFVEDNKLKIKQKDKC